MRKKTPLTKGKTPKKASFKRIRKIVTVILVTVIVVFLIEPPAFFASSMEEIVYSINEKGFAPLDVLGELALAEYDDKEDIITFHYVISDSIFSYNALQSKQDLLQSALRASMASSTDSLKGIVRLIADNAKYMVVMYHDKSSGNFFQVTFGSESLQKTIERKDSIRALTKLCLRIANSQLPSSIGNGIVTQKIRLEKSCVAYDMRLDGHSYKTNGLSSNTESAIDSIVTCLNSHSIGISTFLPLCERLKIGIAFNFVGEASGFRVDIPYSKLPPKDEQWTIEYKPTATVYEAY